MEEKIHNTFGYKSIWLAIEKNDKEIIQQVLKIQEADIVNWDVGLQCANELNGLVMITEPYGGWNFVVGLSLPNLSFHKNTLQWLSDISLQLNRVFYFCSYHTVGYFGFAKVIKGNIERAYTYLGEQGEVALNIGNITQEEKEFGFKFACHSDELWKEGFTELDEEELIQLAGAWSFHPEQLIGCPKYNVICGALLMENL